MGLQQELSTLPDVVDYQDCVAVSKAVVEHLGRGRIVTWPVNSGRTLPNPYEGGDVDSHYWVDVDGYVVDLWSDGTIGPHTSDWVIKNYGPPAEWEEWEGEDNRPNIPATKYMKESLEETLITAHLDPKKSMYAIRPDTLTLTSVTEAMEHCDEDVTLLLVKPPYIVVEATDLDPSIGTPIEDFADIVQDDGDELEVDADAGSENDRGEGYEITPDDWANVLLICNGQGDSVDDVAIEWLTKAGLVKKTSGGHPQPTALARNWTKEASTT